MESATHSSKQTENCVYNNTNPRLPENVNYIPMGFSDSNLKKVCEWFPASFLQKEKVFAIQEVEPALLKLFTRVHETSNKQGRKRGGRKVLLLGQEVFGDTFLACGRCGYHSPDNSNVRKHHRRKVCLVDRGYSRSQLRGMDAKERKNFLQQLSSRRYRERCKNISQQHRVAEDGTDTSMSSESTPCRPTAVVTTTNAISTVEPPSVSISSALQPVTSVEHSGSFTLTAPPHTTVRYTNASSDDVPCTSLLECGNAGSRLSSALAPPHSGASVKAVDCGDLLDGSSDDLLDRCPINSEMESCALLDNLTNSDIGFNGVLPSTGHRGDDLNISSADVAVTNDGRIPSDLVVNHVSAHADIVPYEGSVVHGNQSSFSKSILDSETNNDFYFSVPVSSNSQSVSSVLPLGHASEMYSSKLLDAKGYGMVANDQINELHSSDTLMKCSSKITVANSRKGFSLKSNSVEGAVGINDPTENRSDDRLVSNGSIVDTSEGETIVLVSNCLPEASQPNLCIISMLEEGSDHDKSTRLVGLHSPDPPPSLYGSSLQFISLPMSTEQHSKNTLLIPSQISSFVSDKKKDQVPSTNSVAGDTEPQDAKSATGRGVGQSWFSFGQNTNSACINSPKVSFINNSSGNRCRIMYSDRKISTTNSDLSSMNPTLQPTTDRKVNPMLQPTTDRKVNPTLHPTTDRKVNPTVQPTTDRKINLPLQPTTDHKVGTQTTFTHDDNSPALSGITKSSQSINPLLQETAKKKVKKRKGLTLGPVEAREPIARLPYDLYTVNEYRERVAWKPIYCHKAPSTVGCPPCQIAFRGARRCRRCLALPLPYLLLYRKLDCRTHHCHFTLFHPHARHQLAAVQDQAVRATVAVRIYADTVMSQEFHHYLRSLWSCRLKPSQASRHITGVWAEVLRDRVAEYHLDLQLRQLPPIEVREHHEHQKHVHPGTSEDQRHGEPQKDVRLGIVEDPGRHELLKQSHLGTTGNQELLLNYDLKEQGLPNHRYVEPAGDSKHTKKNGES